MRNILVNSIFLVIAILVNYLLVILFLREYYLVYFVLLVMAIIILNIFTLFHKKLFLLSTVLFVLIFFSFENEVFEIYLYCNINNIYTDINSFITPVLIFLHLFIFFLGYNSKKYL